MKFKRAIILSAGFGKRLRPLTDKIPKPLVKINNITLLENTLRFLKKLGVQEIAINVHYLAEQVIHFLKSFDNEYNIKIFKEEKILGTGGGILNCLPFFLDEKFIAINCDTIWNTQYEEPINILSTELEKEKSSIGLLVIEKNKSFDERLKGDFSRDSTNPNLLVRNDKAKNYLIYTGFQIIEPKVFQKTKLTTFSMNEVWNKAIKERKLIGQTQAGFTTFYHITDYEIYNKIKNQKITNF